MSRLDRCGRLLSPCRRTDRLRLPLLFLVASFLGSPILLEAQSDYTEFAGTLEDGTDYMVRVPEQWNGTLIRDLDYGTAANSDRYMALLNHGYAVSGTARHARRWFDYYDPVREIRHLDSVLDIFVDHFGEPRRILQYGCSGGGHLALAIAESFHRGRIDGVIATGAHTPVWIMNTGLDGWTVLRALLAPELQIIDLPGEDNLRPQHIDLVEAWQEVIHQAQRTPEGRARIALALTIGQWPDWVTDSIPNPNRSDVHELQRSMYLSALQHATPGYIGGVSRYMFENPDGGGGQLSWNVGVDYGRFFENGNEYQKRAVRALYQEAGLDLDADLQQVNDFPRVEADRQAVEYWSQTGRTVWGEPEIPVFRMHAIGDYIVPPSPVQGYNDLIRENGKDDLYRSATVEYVTHCGFPVGAVSAAVETMMRRLDTGIWGPTDPESLNALARELNWDGTSGHFIEYDDYGHIRYNRTWVPGR